MLKLRRPGAGVFEEKCFLILVWCRIAAAQQSWTFVARFLVSWCAKCFLFMEGLDCRQTSSWTSWTLSPSKPCCCDGCSMWLSIVLLKYAKLSRKEMLSGWEHLLLLNLYVLFSIDGSFPDVSAAHTIDTNATPGHQRWRLLSYLVIKSQMVSLLFSPQDMASMDSWNNSKFWLISPQNSFSQTILEELCSRADGGVSESCSHMASSLCDTVLTWICGLHGKLSSHTVISGSVP